jgi:hypothetical protein
VWCRGSWDSEVPTRVKRFSGGGRCVVCPRAEEEFALSLNLEDKGYAVLFQNKKVFMHSEGASPDTLVNIGVREGKVYRLQGKL